MEIRVVSYNVHSWMNGRFSPTFDGIIEVLKSLSPDVVCLQECYINDGQLEKCASELGGFKFFFVACEHPKFGNVILSRFEIKETFSKSLKCERMLQIVKLDVGDGMELTIANTHFDHVQENVRVAQARRAHKYIKSIGIGQHFLIGDFNSVKRDDYSARGWREIEKYRSDHHWEPPRSDVLDFLFSKAGYIDCMPQERESKCLFDSVACTCRCGWRIDYMLMKGSDEGQWKLLEGRIVPLDVNPSDHFPITILLSSK